MANEGIYRKTKKGRTAIATLGNRLGLRERVTLVQKCNGVEELGTRLKKCRDVIKAMAGRRKAEEFWTWFQRGLAKSLICGKLVGDPGAARSPTRQVPQ